MPRPKKDPNAPAKPAVDKGAKFVDLANTRVNKALVDLEKVQKLGNKNLYTYDAEQASKIVEALQTAVQAIEKAFKTSKDARATFAL